MNSMNRISSRTPRRGIGFCIILLILSIFPVFAESTNGPARLQNIRVLFLGDSITYNGQFLEDLEAYCVSRFPGQHFEFINVGLSSETVSGLTEPGHAGGKYTRPDLHERLARILAKTKPGLIFACYGMNDGIYYPFSEERFKSFQDGMNWLHSEAGAAGAPIVHVTPPVFDAVPVAAKITNAEPYRSEERRVGKEG